MSSPREKLQELLREIFQFGSADLDFGIYRIMNFKRDAIEQFIQKDLIKAVDKELSSGMLASQSEAALELKEIAAQVREQLNENALNGDGTLAKEFHNTTLGKRYLELQSRASEAQERPAFEATIFNHLYAFFSRYYDNGDFLSKRRYSRRQKYAIPYNGEEMYLHWANNDQYYVKTGEYFNNYRFKSPYEISVHLMLVAADIEKNNVKGDKRFFVALSHDVAFDAEEKEITIPFQYRPLTEQEEIKYGQHNQQDAIINEALNAIPARLERDVEALLTLLSTHHTTADGRQVNYLEHHLRQYTRRNMSDFFVHKDLKGFLNRELDFYLKNEVLNLDEIEAGGEARSEAWFQIMRVIKSIGGRVIEFLAQIEDFQKRLFEKRKFILETQYCVTMANVPEDFYAEIAECESQWQEWKELLHLDEKQPNLFTSATKNKIERRISALKEHRTLVIDTKNFDKQFKDQLLSHYEDLDELTDGLLICGENFQTLNLLLEKYREKIRCIYIDPPYNTGSDEFIYKDNYRHSSWMSMIYDRITLGIRFLANEAFFLTSIDDNEVHNLMALQRSLYGDERMLSTITWEKRTKAQNTETARQMLQSKVEYILVLRRNTGQQRFRLEPREKKVYPLNDKWGAYRLQEVGQMAAKGGRGRRTMVFPIHGIMPRDGMQWKLGQEEVSRLDEAKRLVIEGDKPMIIIRPDQEDVTRYSPFWSHFFDKDTYGTAESGSEEVRSDLGFGRAIETVKPTKLITKLMFHTTNVLGDLVFDYFAGSGTTGHAIINLNREDNGNRKFILVELGDYFDSILVPRIKKVTFTPEWKDGKPKRSATTEEAEHSPRIVKYIRLESYEDTLNNIRFLDVPKKLYEFDDYLLKYMLAWETKESETLLNVEKLASPFNYKLTITGGEELQEKLVDIPETFAYLLGLNIKTRRVYQDGERHYLVYRGNIDHREIAVIWRETARWEKEDYERDKQFVNKQKLTEGVDEIFINGDSYVPTARALESVFKSRMFGSL